MIHISIICIGKLKETYLKEATSEYTKRLSKYCKLSIVELPDEKIPDKSSERILADIQEKESASILSHIPKDSYVMALDLTGRQYSSEEFATQLDNISMLNISICFLIGGPLGMTRELVQKANSSICFSKMTFPHQLIRVFLLEQIFRAFKILHGETYHR